MIFSFRMITYVGKSNEELASAFITSTCQLIAKSPPRYFHYMRTCNLMAAPTTRYKITCMCGSQAEFYIRPLISCIDDIDYLVTRADYLVFSGEFSVLPSDFSDLAETIIFFVIEPYHRYPGFVRLRKFGDMNYNWKLQKHVFNYIDYQANIISNARVDLDQI